jgi:GTP cyclohydrolase II
MNTSIDSIERLQDRGQIAVEHGFYDLRAGRVAALRAETGTLYVAGAETVDAALAGALDRAAGGRARLILPQPRLRRLGVDLAEPAGSVALPRVDLAALEPLVLAPTGRLEQAVRPASAAELASLELARLAAILPAVIVVPAPDGTPAIEVADVTSYRNRQVRGLRMVGRARVPLEGADAEFVVFRGGEGLRDQVAVIVGQPDLTRPVPVRLHSACLTGDLFGSLKCDCGDQLRDTVRGMAASGGGVLLYLDQEGRGNGIANKIRAYRLQGEGYDTYDADAMLGFGLDQRRFDFAAEMLRLLGISRVRLLTNNPDKIAALGAAGLEVVAVERVFGRPTRENMRYLAAKRDRAGHHIEPAALYRPAAE